MTVRNHERAPQRHRRRHYYWSAVTVGVLIAWAAAQGFAPPVQQRSSPEVPPVVVSVPPWKAAGAEAPVVSELASHGIPVVAHRAYVEAEGRLAEEKAQCGIDWALIAAIGRVETDHGRFGGSQLRADGATSHPIRGMRLDGSNGTARIADTDGGRLDGDQVFDRAVGPMQFIPSTWKSAGAGGDADNVVHAAAGAGRYLCGDGEDLRGEPGQRAAVFRYNNSEQYVDLVLRIANAYRAGHGAVLPRVEPGAGSADREALDTAPLPVPEPPAPPPLEIPDVEVPTAEVDPAPVQLAPETETPESTPAAPSPDVLLPPDPSVEPTPAESSEVPSEDAPAESEASGERPTTQPTTNGIPVVDGRIELPDCPVDAAVEVRSADGSALGTRAVDVTQRLDVSAWFQDGALLEPEGCSAVQPR